MEGKDGLLGIPLRDRDYDIRQRAAVRLSRSMIAALAAYSATD